MSDTTSKGNSPKPFTKKKEVVSVGFKASSRFGGGGSVNSAKSQYKPMPVRITQHKG